MKKVESSESSFDEKTKKSLKKKRIPKSKKLIEDECSSVSDIDSSCENGSDSNDSFINDDENLSEDSYKSAPVKKKKV